jgi:hypothetical protein
VGSRLYLKLIAVPLYSHCAGQCCMWAEGQASEGYSVIVRPHSLLWLYFFAYHKLLLAPMSFVFCRLGKFLLAPEPLYPTLVCAPRSSALPS